MKKNFYLVGFQRTSVVILLLSVFSYVAYADVPPPTAGSEEKRFKEETYLKDKDALQETQPKKMIANEADDQIPESYKSVTFKLNEVRFSGNESIKTEDLQEVVKPLIGREINFQMVLDAVSDVKKLYRRRGYVATYIFVPEQDIKTGVLQIKVVEGRLGNLGIVGNNHFPTDLLRNQIKIKQGDVIQYKNFKSDLVRLNKHPDIDTRAVLKPGSAVGTTDILVETTDRSPIHLGVDVNNLGTRDTGKYRYGVSAAHNNLTGRLDDLSGRFQMGKGAWAVGENYDMPIGDLGTRLGFAYSHASIDVGGDFSVLGLEGDADTYTPYLTHPLVEQEHWDVTLNTGMDIKNVQNRVLGAVSGEDNLRILNVAFNIEQRDSDGRTFAPQTFSEGLGNFLSGSDKLDSRAIRTGTGGQFFIYRGSLVRYQRLPWHELMLSVRGTWQVTPDRLPSSEQLRLGGAQSVRGYQEGEYLADNGGFITTEIMAPIYFIPKDLRLPYAKEELRKQIQMLAFVDFGAGDLKKPLTGERPEHSLTGAGAGLRIHLYDKCYGRVEWGFPIGSTPSDSRDSAFYFGVSYELL